MKEERDLYNKDLELTDKTILKEIKFLKIIFQWLLWLQFKTKRLIFNKKIIKNKNTQWFHNIVYFWYTTYIVLSLFLLKLSNSFLL